MTSAAALRLQAAELLRQAEAAEAIERNNAHPDWDLITDDPYPIERGVRLWTCTICGHTGVWTDAWRWYGSLLDETPEFVTCSRACRRSPEADRLAARPRTRRGDRLAPEPRP